MFELVYRRIFWLIIVLVLGIVLGIGCARQSKMARRPLPTVEEIVTRIRQNGAGLRDFEGRAKISIQSKGVKHNLKAVVLFKRPDALKMELTGFMGMSLATMAVQNGSFQIYLPMMNRVLEGRLESRQLQSLMGVPFDFYDMKDILFGVNMPGTLWDSEATVVGTRQGQYLLSKKGEDRIWKVWVDATKLLVVKEEVLDLEGHLLVRKVYGNYLEDDGVEIPRAIHITRGNEEVDIRFTACDINSGLSDSQFEIIVPEDAVRVNL